ETKVVGITQDGVRTEMKDGPEFITADTVVVAAGSRSENGLAGLLEDVIPEIHVVGDAKSPRNALTAIREGFEAGLSV
ncbi:MAG TPA: NADH:flavin oxidoreductase, partial [Deltaproteobacteria bacterium]|nr:NADH:flavin oxidoreductase [Deltaproteobacteria bacterium]